MLNLSNNSINDKIRFEEFRSTKLLMRSQFKSRTILIGLILLIGGIVCLFLPWTQNINTKGTVTTRSPEQRPQSIQPVIPGRVEKWFIMEGDFVEKGDTIVLLSEINNSYFDPELIERTSEQVDAKSQSISSYDQKIAALQQQYNALKQSMQLKLAQTENKIIQTKNKIAIDSADLVAFKANLEIAYNQLERIQKLHEKGLKSLSELQEKELKVQEVRAKVTVQENKLMNQKNELTNLIIELTAVEQDYQDKMAKSQSDQQSALSNKLQSIAETSKLRNQLSNYNQRQQFYQITAPQSGYITKTIKKGIGEIIKDGSDLATIMPANYDLAVESYVKPQDVPLLRIGKEVQLRFDGWPAIVISGWPESSTGIFKGNVVAIDQYISENGLYRIFISPKEGSKPWPYNLRVGTGASTILLLKNVPIWYEIWRQLNGFPPDYYQNKAEEDKKEEVKTKAPLKSIK